MSDLKTKPTDASVESYLANVSDPARRQDCQALVEMMRKVTGSDARLWGTGLIGFGQYHYKYASGHEGDSPLSGFAARKDSLTVYVMAGVERFPALLAKLGKHKAGKGCLYVKRLSDVDAKVLEELVTASVAHVRKAYPA